MLPDNNCISQDKEINVQIVCNTESLHLMMRGPLREITLHVNYFLSVD